MSALADFLGTRYISTMTQATAVPTKIVRNPKTGEFVTVRGAGSLKGSKFAIKKGVDLTKPVAKQALKGASSPKRRTSSKAGKG